MKEDLVNKFVSLQKCNEVEAYEKQEKGAHSQRPALYFYWKQSKHQKIIKGLSYRSFRPL